MSMIIGQREGVWTIRKRKPKRATQFKKFVLHMTNVSKLFFRRNKSVRSWESRYFLSIWRQMLRLPSLFRWAHQTNHRLSSENSFSLTLSTLFFSLIAKEFSSHSRFYHRGWSSLVSFWIFMDYKFWYLSLEILFNSVVFSSV